MIDDRYLSTLEYFKILDQLAGYTSFSASHELALALRPSTEKWEVRQTLQETTEAKALLSVRPDVSIGGAHDVRPLARRAALEALLFPRDLLDIRGTLISVRSMKILLSRFAAEYPLLGDRAAQLQPLGHIIDAIGRCLDDEGRVLDSASPELAHLRRESVIVRDRVIERLQRIVAATDNARFVQDAIITERNGRYVIPLKAEYKGRIPGIIHDQSSSGATIFIEPLVTVELNNQWHELQLAEQREVERILHELTLLVGDDAELIEHDVEVLAAIDLALAKARYSYALRASPVEFVEQRWPSAETDAALQPGQHPLCLRRARHPLLPADKVVPIDVHLGGNYTVLLVTGPNTGGKTVSLKTVGLLAAMSQAGMHIPADEGSRLPIFDGIYADIGDEQSIEQSLSTFSSHMTHIVDILSRADAGSLVLLDELGAGTDPVEGAALAQALITTLIERRCLTMCSSHYSQLKMYAFNTPCVQNASVEFDIETLSPTYRLIIGLPGRSNAFAIAERLGLDKGIIEKAQALVSPDDLAADNLLASVKAADEAAAAARHDAEALRSRAESLERELRKKLAAIEEARREVLDQARAEGRQELERLRAEVRKIQLGLMDHGPAATQVVREAMQVIEQLAEGMAPIAAPQPEVAPPAETVKGLEIGDIVYVSTLKQTGELLSIAGQDAEVQVGGFRLRTRLAALEFRSRPRPVARTEPTIRRAQVESPGIEMDLRGWRAEDVAPALDKYLDNAYLAGLPWVHIIHGKGMGVLKQVVRQFVAGHPLVASYQAGGLGEGGDGVTVVQLHKHSE